MHNYYYDGYYPFVICMESWHISCDTRLSFHIFSPLHTAPHIIIITNIASIYAICIFIITVPVWICHIYIYKVYSILYSSAFVKFHTERHTRRNIVLFFYLSLLLLLLPVLQPYYYYFIHLVFIIFRSLCIGCCCCRCYCSHTHTATGIYNIINNNHNNSYCIVCVECVTWQNRRICSVLYFFIFIFWQHAEILQS